MGSTTTQSRVIIFTGLPGTGKSTLAEQVARSAVERMRAELLPLAVDRLTVDAAEPVADNLRLVLDYISA